MMNEPVAGSMFVVKHACNIALYPKGIRYENAGNILLIVHREIDRVRGDVYTVLSSTLGVSRWILKDLEGLASWGYIERVV